MIAERNLNCAEYLRYCGVKFGEQNAEWQFEKDGHKVRQPIKAILQTQISRKVKWKYAKIETPLYQMRTNLSFWNDWLADEKTLYFKYNRCRDANGFNRLVRGTKGFLAQNKADRFVIDLRHNSGGNSAIFRPLLSFVKNHPELNKKGRLFVIIGRQTFSSGLWNAIEMKQQTNAVLIGEPTGGRPNHYGEVRSFELPNSKLKVHYSTRHWKLMKDKDPETLEPDVRVKLNAKDFFDGKDPYLEAALNYEDKK